MMQVFTENDATLRRCRQNEIGMPWEDRFSVEDYLNDMCTSEQVGKSKDQPPADQDQQSPGAPAPFKPLSKADRRRLLVEMSDKLLIAAHNDPLAFMGDAGPQINKFIDLASKLDTDETPRLADMTAHKLNALPTVERYRAMLAPILEEAPEVRERVLTAWGLTPDTIAALLAEMQEALHV